MYPITRHDAFASVPLKEIRSKPQGKRLLTVLRFFISFSWKTMLSSSKCCKKVNFVNIKGACKSNYKSQGHMCSSIPQGLKIFCKKRGMSECDHDVDLNPVYELQ